VSTAATAADFALIYLVRPICTSEDAQLDRYMERRKVNKNRNCRQTEKLY
jgi:hypothetical protein